MNRKLYMIREKDTNLFMLKHVKGQLKSAVDFKDADIWFSLRAVRSHIRYNKNLYKNFNQEYEIIEFNISMDNSILTKYQG